jgi:hypothetical protein
VLLVTSAVAIVVRDSGAGRTEAGQAGRETVNDLALAVTLSPATSLANPGQSIAHGVRGLVLVLTDLLGALATAPNAATASAGVGWLRPLALASVELEYSIRHRRVDPRDVADACDEVRSLLDGLRSPDAGFAARYVTERASSATVAMTHALALAGCSRVSFLAKGATTESARQRESTQHRPTVLVQAK